MGGVKGGVNFCLFCVFLLPNNHQCCDFQISAGAAGSGGDVGGGGRGRGTCCDVIGLKNVAPRPSTM